jgi:hypothetical protein
MTQNRARGQVVVLFAVALIFVLGLLGLIFSWGFLLQERSRMQTVADAASMRATWQMMTELQSGRLSESQVLNATTAIASINDLPTDNTVTNSTYLTAVYADANGVPISPTRTVSSSGTFPTAARGVCVTARRDVSTTLPGFLGVSNAVTAAYACALAYPVRGPQSSTLVVPVAVNTTDFRTAFTNSNTYDLFSPGTLPTGTRPPSLDYRAGVNNPDPGADDYGPVTTDLQYWSDGQHNNGTLTVGGTVGLMGVLESASIAAGISDNIRRQGLVDGDGQAYGLIVVPLWSSSQVTPSPAVTIAGFGVMKVRATDVSASAVRGTFVLAPQLVTQIETDLGTVGDVGARFIRLIG